MERVIDSTFKSIAFNVGRNAKLVKTSMTIREKNELLND